MESFRSFEYREEKPPLSRVDRIIQAAILDQEASKALFETDPVKWIKGAIGVDTDRGASTISDKELYNRYMEGGKFEWDPTVAKAVKRYLTSKGW